MLTSTSSEVNKSILMTRNGIAFHIANHLTAGLLQETQIQEAHRIFLALLRPQNPVPGRSGCGRLHLTSATHQVLHSLSLGQTCSHSADSCAGIEVQYIELGWFRTIYLLICLVWTWLVVIGRSCLAVFV